MKPSLTLISHHLCPYVQRVAIALTEKQVPFNRVYVELSNKPAWFSAISPLGKVPLLQVSEPGRPDAVLFESAVICEYIEDTQSGPRLHPSEPLERARHRAWIEFGSSVLSDIWGLETAQESELFESKRQALAGKFQWLEATLGTGPYFSGAHFSLVDAVFGPVFRYFDTFDQIFDTQVMAQTPAVRAWRQALAARPSVATAVDAAYHDRLRQFLVRHDAFILRAGREAMGLPGHRFKLAEEAT
jgi:glutathione S-transferase